MIEFEIPAAIAAAFGAFLLMVLAYVVALPVMVRRKASHERVVFVAVVGLVCITVTAVALQVAVHA